LNSKAIINYLLYSLLIAGVYTLKQFRLLKNLGFQDFQGYLVSKAERAKDLNLENTTNNV